MESKWAFLSDRGRGVLIGYAGPCGDVITATVPRRDDARRIVEAVNAYDTLRARVAELEAALESVCVALLPHDSRCQNVNAVFEAHDRARAALKGV